MDQVKQNQDWQEHCLSERTRLRSNSKSTPLPHSSTNSIEVGAETVAVDTLHRTTKIGICCSVTSVAIIPQQRSPDVLRVDGAVVASVASHGVVRVCVDSFNDVDLSATAKRQSG